MAVVRQGFHPQQLQSQPVYALEAAVEMRLVDDLPGEDRVSVFSIHLHPFEGHSVPAIQLATHYYAVDCPRAFAHHPFAADHYLHLSIISLLMSPERRARRVSSSSPTGAFPLGDFAALYSRLPPGRRCGQGAESLSLRCLPILFVLWHAFHEIGGHLGCGLLPASPHGSNPESEPEHKRDQCRRPDRKA